MIEIQQLTKRFGRLDVLRGIDLELPAGECIALIGPNGCGKTTLIKCILGLVIPTSGEVRFGGESVLHRHEYRRHIGYMPQIGRYPDNMSIGQVMALIRELRSESAATDLELYEAYQLEKMLGKTMRTLSGGTTQKVSAMLAFLFSPQVLILDEPTAGLDPLAAEILKQKILKEKAAGKLILITSHLLSELDELITRVIFMQDGSVQFHRPVAELLADTGTNRLSKAIAHYLTLNAHA